MQASDLGMQIIKTIKNIIYNYIIFDRDNLAHWVNKNDLGIKLFVVIMFSNFLRRQPVEPIFQK